MNISDMINDPQQPIRAPALMALAAGDLVSFSEVGGLIKTPEKLPFALANSTTAGPSVVRALTQVDSAGGNAYDSNGGPMRRLAELGDGNLALVYSGDGATTSTALNLVIRNAAGGIEVPKRVLTTDPSISAYRLVKISGTQFAVVWTVSTTLKFAVLNNDGTTAVAETTVATLAGGSANNWNVAALASGQLVLAYNKTASNNLNFSRFNAAGQLQGAETTVEAAASPSNIALIGCSNGDFVVSYFRTAATASYKAARYTGAGAIVGALASFGTGGYTLSSGDFSNGIVELSNGNVAMAVPGTADGYPDIKVYSSTHTPVASLDLGAAGSIVQTNEVPQLIALAGRFAIIARNSTYSSLWVFSDSGAELLPRTNIGSSAVAGTAAAGTGITAFSLGSAGYAVLRAGHDGTNYEVRLFCVSPAGDPVGSEVVLRASGANPVYAMSAVLHSSGVLGLACKDNGSPYLATAHYNVVRRSVLGVAAAAAAAGAQATVRTKGAFTINQAMGAGGIFDNRAASVPGTKGAVIGSSAVLMGVAA